MKAWKALQKNVRDKFKKAGLDARDVSFDTSESPDILLVDFPQFMIDCKHSVRFRHWRLWQETKKKYCNKSFDEAVLITKQKNSAGELVIVSLDIFIMLLQELKNG